MKLELREPAKKGKGKLLGEIEVPVEELAKSLSPHLSVSSTETGASLQQRDEKIADLEADNAKLMGKASTLDKFDEMLKTPEGFVDLANNFGYSSLLKTEMPEEDAAALQEADVILAKDGTPEDIENWVLLKNLGMWVRKK